MMLIKGTECPLSDILSIDGILHIDLELGTPVDFRLKFKDGIVQCEDLLVRRLLGVIIDYNPTVRVDEVFHGDGEFSFFLSIDVDCDEW